MDAAFPTARFPSYTTAQLRQFVAHPTPATDVPALQAEISRREKVAAGDMSVMTSAERLRHNDQQEKKAAESKLVDDLHSIDPQLAVWASQRIADGLTVHLIKARLRRAMINSGRE